MRNIATLSQFLAFVMAGPCFGQISSIYGSLRVLVVDASGAQVPGASIALTMPERCWTRTATATAESTFFPALAPGDSRRWKLHGAPAQDQDIHEGSPILTA